MAKKGSKWIAVRWFPTLKQAKTYKDKRKGSFKAVRAGDGFGLYKKKQ
jgi:hypothetical protein